MLKAVHTIDGMELTSLGRRNCPAAQAAAAHLFLTLSSVSPSLVGTPAALRRRCISGRGSRPSAVALSASRRARTRLLGPGRWRWSAGSSSASTTACTSRNWLWRAGGDRVCEHVVVDAFCLRLRCTTSRQTEELEEVGALGCWELFDVLERISVAPNPNHGSTLSAKKRDCIFWRCYNHRLAAHSVGCNWFSKVFDSVPGGQLGNKIVRHNCHERSGQMWLSSRQSSLFWICKRESALAVLWTPWRTRRSPK